MCQSDDLPEYKEEATIGSSIRESFKEVKLEWDLPEAMAMSHSRIILRGEAQKMLEEEE
ncbi:MAG: hypothetical protein ACSHYF_18165 [Verrucomicrobiaceae bacterium]